MAEITKTSFPPEKVDKIKVINPQIIVSGTVDNPYYEISYYDIAKKDWRIGYSSYDLEYVFEWLNKCFEVIEADVEPVKHGEWKEITTHNGCTYDYDCVCSECRRSGHPFDNYCPNCGAKMEGKEVQE